ncbi:MAG TPA: hypothetical protein PLY96_13690, partial [Chromatiaceae bacterium]|nr:hypothetical protein [Chromatiaceae bacterium]
MNHQTPSPVGPGAAVPISPARREFLRRTGLLLTAPAWLTACGGRDGDRALDTTCALGETDNADGAPVYLADYEPPAFFIDEIELT